MLILRYNHRTLSYVVPPLFSLFVFPIDSLCDVVCFGVFPIVLCYELGMTHFYSIPILIFYGLAGVIRLGYFNVMEEKRQNETSENRKYYQGLPITSMSVALTLLFVFAPLCRGYFLIWLHLLVLAVGVLFITDFRFRKPTNKELAVLVAVVGVAVHHVQKTVLQIIFLADQIKLWMIFPLFSVRISAESQIVLPPFQIRSPLVAPFVKKNHISLKECTAKQFISFNDFFVRKLKMDARPFSNAPHKEIIERDKLLCGTFLQ